MIGLLALASATAGQFFTGNDLYRFCVSTAASDRAFCNGFVSAVADTERVVDSYRTPPIQHLCIDNAVIVDQLRDVAIRYLKEYPERRSYSAASILTDAFERAFPCK